jgi:hypothetical protein
LRERVREAGSLSGRERVEALLRLVDVDLAEDAATVDLIADETAHFGK